MTPTQKEIVEYFASRSRSSNYKRCPRARYLLDEAQGHGWSPIKLAIPLVTGGSVHVGLAQLLRDGGAKNDLGEEQPWARGPQGFCIDQAVMLALRDYADRTKDRGFDLQELESQSFVYNEQKALIEALVRMAGLRVVPRLLLQYEVLEVEQPDSARMSSDPLITWRSIPDALLRSRADGDLYLLSWKTVSEFSQRTVDDARVDMQGLSEAWAWEQAHQGKMGEILPEIRGVQMVYLIKGSRRASSQSTALEQGLSADQIAQGGKVYKTASPLIYGYSDQSFPPKLAWASEWHCTGPHGEMRPSRWYPKGECPGNKNHRRGDDWSSFPVWESMGIKEWLRMLDAGEITPEAGDPLESSWAMPVPFFRTAEQSSRWLRQTKAQEVRIAQSLEKIRPYEDPEDEVVQALLSYKLDEEFPQSTDQCNRWFGRKCPVSGICHGPSHIAADPLASGLFQIKEPAPAWAEVDGE